MKAIVWLGRWSLVVFLLLGFILAVLNRISTFHYCIWIPWFTAYALIFFASIVKAVRDKKQQPIDDMVGPIFLFPIFSIFFFWTPFEPVHIAWVFIVSMIILSLTGGAVSRLKERQEALNHQPT